MESTLHSKKKPSFMRDQMSQFLEFMMAVDIFYFNFAVLEPRKSGAGMCMNGDSRPRVGVEVENSIGWAAKCNAEGANVYFRPARLTASGELLAHPVVFMDDLPIVLAEKIGRKYRSVVISTSRDNCQVWIIACKPLKESERKEVQRNLASLVGADMASVSGEHFGRAPGFRNQKPDRNGHWVCIKQMNVDGPAFDPTPYIQSQPHSPLPPRGACAINPTTAVRPVPSVRGNDDSASSREFGFALHRLKEGKPIGWVVDQVAEHAFARGKRATQAASRQYAQITVEHAAVAAGIRI